MRSLRDRLRRFVPKLAREHDEPGRLVAACVLGATVSSTPLFGLALPICIALPFLFLLHKVPDYARDTVAIPPRDALPDAIHVVELGTGLGILPVLLALLGLRRKVTGVDHDQAKIEEGRRAAKGLRVELLPGDLRTFAIPPCDALVLIDVLHYLPREEQAEVLRRAADALRPRGVIFVRDADSAQGSGAGTRLMEAIAVRVGWNRGATPEATHWRPIREIEAELEALGFEVETSVVSGTLHPGNALLVARRP